MFSIVVLCVVMLGVVMQCVVLLGVVMLGVAMLGVVIPCVVMLGVVIPCVVMLGVVMLGVMAFQAELLVQTCPSFQCRDHHQLTDKLGCLINSKKNHNFPQ
jgi:hypothetical protein